MGVVGLAASGLSSFSPALLICLINRERINYGLNLLGLLPGLNRASEYRNGFMAKLQKLAIQLPRNIPTLKRLFRELLVNPDNNSIF